jgi:enoyl-CoA hydratase/carnithine racemase
MTESVLFDELNGSDGHIIGVITLNKPRQLHALSADMFPLLRCQLQAWQTDTRVACVLLQSTGDKAFCAGGDVKSLQQLLVKTSGDTAKAALVRDYFVAEYQVDHLLHCFPKPIIVWGDGIIMGGGLGLFMGASHRVVTETARIAMPEVTIGLFPDVGATWFLNRLPQPGVGLFLGLTGASINAKDAEYLKLTASLIPATRLPQLLTQLLALHWSEHVDEHSVQVSRVLAGLYDDQTFASANLPAHQALFTNLGQQSELAAVIDVIQHCDTIHHCRTMDEWLRRSTQKLLQGSPISAHIVYRQITQYTDLTMADCFRLELDLAVNVCLQGDLVEGVRALLVDKDSQPNWRYQQFAEVPSVFVDSLFNSPWQGDKHPLAFLGE